MILLEAAIGFEPMHDGFAVRCLSTWLRRPGEQVYRFNRLNLYARPSGVKLICHFGFIVFIYNRGRWFHDFTIFFKDISWAAIRPIIKNNATGPRISKEARAASQPNNTGMAATPIKALPT